MVSEQGKTQLNQSALEGKSYNGLIACVGSADHESAEGQRGQFMRRRSTASVTELPVVRIQGRAVMYTIGPS